MSLGDGVRHLVDGKSFAVVSTLEPDGRPHATVVWTQRQGNDIDDGDPRASSRAS
jgi:hypothetical protein